MFEMLTGAERASLLPPIEESGTRLRILEAGLTSFAIRGYHGTSIRQIATSADMQSASLYAHFRSKEEILDRLIRLGHEVHHDALTEALVTADGGPLVQARALVKAHAEAHACYSLLAVVTNVEFRHLTGTNRRAAEEARERSQDLLRRVVRRGVEDGTFSVSDERATIAAISGLGFNAAVWYPRNAAVMTPSEVGETYAELAIRMLGGDTRDR